jgi:hypothetical protein
MALQVCVGIHKRTSGGPRRITCRTGPRPQLRRPKSRNCGAVRSKFALKARLPGTEFLDAETGRQKSSRNSVNAYRDESPGRKWPEIPALFRVEAEFASHREGLVSNKTRHFTDTAADLATPTPHPLQASRLVGSLRSKNVRTTASQTRSHKTSNRRAAILRSTSTILVHCGELVPQRRTCHLSLRNTNLRI